MSICRTSILHPVSTIVFMLLIVIFGILNFREASVCEYPNIEMPNVSVTTSYTGASAAVIETKITQIIEDAISGIDGIDSISSTSKDGQSKVQIEFVSSKNLDEAVNDVRDKVNRYIHKLPDTIDQPIIAKYDSSSMPIIMLSLSSDKMDTMELTDYAQRYLLNRFSTIHGVANVSILGLKEKSMRIWLDKYAMAARGITVEDIEEALKKENVEYPSGRIESVDIEFPVTIKRQYNSVQDFEKLVVKKTGTDSFVRLMDIAKIEIGPKNQRTSFLLNGRHTVSIALSKQSNANTVNISNNVKAIISELNKNFNNKMEISILRNEAKFIGESIKEVYITLLITAILVFLIIFLFLGSWKATLIPSIAIPISVIGSFTILRFFGCNINMMTLLGMVLVIGIVVDDAIVMLENIHRRISEGESPIDAAINGSEQVVFAVISTSVVLLSVFLPICMLGGKLGKLFSEFAISVSAAIFLSTIVALTLTPMMCSRMLKKEDHMHNRVIQYMDSILKKTNFLYGKILIFSIEQKTKFIILFFTICLASGIALQSLHNEFEPLEDRGEVIVKCKAVEGTGFNAICKYMGQVSKSIEKNDEHSISKIMSIVPNFGDSDGPVNSGQIMIELSENSNRKSSVLLSKKFRKVLEPIASVKSNVIMPMGIGSKGGNPIQFVIAGNEYEELKEWRDIIINEAKKYPGITDIDHDYQETTPQFIVNIDKERAAQQDISIQDIGKALEIMLGSKSVTTYVDKGREYDVILQSNIAERQNPTDICEFYVRNKSGRLISLDNVISMKEIGAANKLSRFNRNRAVTITGSVNDGYSLDQCLSFLKNTVKEKLPNYAQIFYKGKSKDLQESSGSLFFIFSLAIVISFLVIASQFESFISPIVIIMSVPLGALGALIALNLFNQNLNIYNEIGLLILIGLSTKQGILIVEFANQLVKDGRNIVDSIIEASKIRLRPIVMTCISTVTGAIPLILATGASAASRKAIGIVEFFGCSLGMVLICIFIPVWYVIILNRKHSINNL